MRGEDNTERSRKCLRIDVLLWLCLVRRREGKGKVEDKGLD